MPAIQIDRLKQQLITFINPQLPEEQFVKNLLELMEAHANLSYRPGLEVQSDSLIPTFELAPLVSFHIQNRIKLIGTEFVDKEKILHIADLIWQQDYLEMKIVASILLGTLPPQELNQIKQRFEQWFVSTTDKEIRFLIFQYGTETIRKENINGWVEIVKGWLSSGENLKIQIGMKALESLITDHNFENYPVVFSITDSIMSLKNDHFTASLFRIYQTLIKKSPAETAYFLQHSLLSSPTDQKIRFIRRCLPFLPLELQRKLREAIKN